MAKAAAVYQNINAPITSLELDRVGNTPRAKVTIARKGFEANVDLYGKDLVEAVKNIGEGRTLWVRGTPEKLVRYNDNGGRYTITGYKGVRIKDITDTPAPRRGKKSDDAAAAEAAASQEAAEAASVAETSAAAEAAATSKVSDEVPF